MSEHAAVVADLGGLPDRARGNPRQDPPLESVAGRDHFRSGSIPAFSTEGGVHGQDDAGAFDDAGGHDPGQHGHRGVAGGRDHGDDQPGRSYADTESTDRREAGLGPDAPDQARLIRLERDILGRNDALAEGNRRFFAERGLFALNLVSSPGSGKTTLLVRTAAALKARFPVAVIEGDQQTSRDAERIRAVGVPALQVNTGKGCHLDAGMIGRAIGRLDLPVDGVLLIENVGNLVCPAAFDLGEAHKVVVLSVTEGEDKPLKYPDMFAAADLMVLNKVDLLPHLDFDVARCIDYARRVNPRIQVLRVSATTGAGIDAWCDWIAAGRDAARALRRAQG